MLGRPRNTLALSVATLPFAICLMVSCVCNAAPIYRLVDLNTLGGPNSFALAVNNSGQVVGASEIDLVGFPGHPLLHPFLYSDGSLIDLGTLGGDYGAAYAINDSGVVAGEAQTSGGFFTHAFRTDGKLKEDLGTLSGSNSVAYGINAHNQVVGFAGGDMTHHGSAFLYETGPMIDLDTFPGGATSSARGINAAGNIVGDAQPNGFFPHAFLWTAGTFHDLGTLGGGGSTANAINDDGLVVGSSALAGDSGAHGFLYNGASLVDLGTLGGPDSNAFSINAGGDIVGQSETASGEARGFLYTTDTMLDINALLENPSTGWTVTEARAINDAGWIVGAARTQTGNQHAVLLVPVPEPASVAGTLFSLSSMIIGRRIRVREATSGHSASTKLLRS